MIWVLVAIIGLQIVLILMMSDAINRLHRLEQDKNADEMGVPKESDLDKSFWTKN